MNTARKLEFKEVYEGIDQIGTKNATLLSNLILSPDTSAFEAISYWEKKLLNASEEEKIQYKQQIDILQRNIMAKAMIIGDILNSAVVTRNITSTITADETITAEEVKDEVPVINFQERIKTKDVVKDKPETTEVEMGPVEKTEPVQKTEKEVIEEAINDETSKLITNLRSEALALIRDGKEDDAKFLLTSYLKTDNWTTKSGKPGHAMKPREFEGFWKDVLSQGKEEKAPVETKSKETTETVKEEVVETGKVLTEEQLAQQSIRVYTKAYPPKETDIGGRPIYEKTVLEFSKPLLNVTEEEAKIQEVFEKVQVMFSEKKQNDAWSLIRLFFLGRSYSDVQVGKWAEEAKMNRPIKNHLEFLSNAITLKEVSSIGEIMKVSAEAVNKDKATYEVIWDWFKANVLNKKLKEQDEAITDETALQSFFNSTIGYLFKKKESNPVEDKTSPETIENAVVETVTLLTTKIKEANSNEVGFANVVNRVKEELKAKNIVYNLSDLFHKAEEIAKTENPELYRAYKERKDKLKAKTTGKTNDDIKPNEDFEKEAPKTEEVVETTADPVEETTEVIEDANNFTNLRDLMDYIMNSYNETKNAEVAHAVAQDYIVTRNCIEDAKDWDKEQVKLVIDGFIEGTEARKPNSVTESGEPAATATEAVTDAPTEEVVAEESNVESTESSTITTSEESSVFDEISKAKNHKQLTESIVEAYEANSEMDSKVFTSKVYDSIANSKNPGKYVRKLAKNKKEDLYRTINKILDAIPETVEAEVVEAEVVEEQA